MDLREYLFKKRMTIASFARLIGYSPVYISSAMRGQSKTGKKFRLTVMTCTGGEVDYEQWPDVITIGLNPNHNEISHD